MKAAFLPDRGVVKVAGDDARDFLNGLVTTDMTLLRPGLGRFGALLTPQGKILFDFLISRDLPDGFLLECRVDIADDFLRRLILYRLRAKAEIAKRDHVVVGVSWDDDSASSQTDLTGAGALRDRRFFVPARVLESTPTKPYSAVAIRRVASDLPILAHPLPDNPEITIQAKVK